MHGYVVNNRWRVWVVILDRPLRVRRSGRTFRSYDAYGSGIYIYDSYVAAISRAVEIVWVFRLWQSGPRGSPSVLEHVANEIFAVVHRGDVWMCVRGCM